MRFIILSLVLLWAGAVKAEELNMQEPPFWMSSYEEFQDLQQFQKDFYLNKLSTELGKISSLNNISESKLQDATEWYKDWNSIRRRVYTVCKDKSLAKECEAVADTRIDALNLMANQKLENRKADEAKPKKKLR